MPDLIIPHTAATSTPPLDPVIDLLGGDRTIAFKSSLSHVGGGALAGLLLSQFWYYSNMDTALSRDGWFYKTQAEIEDETGMTRYEQEGARKKLRELGVLQEEKRGIPAKLWFRLDKPRLGGLLRQYAYVRQARREAASKDGEKPQAGAGEKPMQARAKTPGKVAEYPHPTPKTSPEKPKTSLRLDEVTPLVFRKEDRKEDRKEEGPPPAARKGEVTVEEKCRVYKSGAAKIKAALDAAKWKGSGG